MEKYYDLKCLLKNTKDEKLKIFIYRNSYNELGLSTLCVEKDKEIERLKQDNEYLNKVNIELSSRNSKAIEYMNYTFNISSVKEMYEIMDELEKILQGSYKEKE